MKSLVSELGLKCETSWKELSYVLSKNVVARVPVRFYFFQYYLFSLCIASISHLLTVAVKCFCFCFSYNESRLHCFLSIALSGSSSSSNSLCQWRHQNLFEKTTRLCYYFFSLYVQLVMWFTVKISASCIWVAVQYKLIELFYISMPVVRTGGSRHYQNVCDAQVTKVFNNAYPLWTWESFMKVIF